MSDENTNHPLEVILGNFAYGQSRMAVNKEKIGWISKIHPNNRVTIKYPTGKSATWSRKNVVVVHPNEVDEEIKEGAVYKEFIDTLNGGEWFSPVQEEVLCDFKEWLDQIQRDIESNKEDVSNLSGAVAEKMNQLTNMILHLNQRIEEITEVNNQLRGANANYGRRVALLEESVRQLTQNTIPSSDRGDANTHVSESTGGETDPVSLMSEVIDLDYLHH